MNDLYNLYDLYQPESLRAPLLSGLALQADAAFVQVNLELSRADPLAWLQGQLDPLQFFWTSRKRAFMVAAIGRVHSWDSLSELELALQGLAPELRCYGGWRFGIGPVRDPWQDWPQQGFFLPRWELRCEQGRYRLCLNLAGPRSSWPEQLDQALASLRPPQDLACHLPSLGPLWHMPDQETWFERVAQSQKLFAQDQLQKLVLSRQSSALLDALPLSLMQGLLEQGREAYHFWFRPDGDQVLWGASPERLYARQGLTLWTEALAGTRPRPLDPALQESLRQELLGSHKEFEENERVREHLEAVLGPICTALRAEPLRVIPSGPVQHLYRCLQAELAPGSSDAQLATLLHPTPAVSGYPSRAAVRCLRELETHDRGWYAGSLGWISPQASEWAVILRCALWKQPMLHFFTGAGIMPASDPMAEWQELDVKLSSLLALWDEPSVLIQGA